MKYKDNIIGEAKDLNEKDKIFIHQTRLNNLPLEKGFHRKTTAFTQNSKTRPYFRGQAIDYVVYDKSDKKTSKENTCRLFVEEDRRLYQVLIRKKDLDGDYESLNKRKTRLKEII